MPSDIVVSHASLDLNRMPTEANIRYTKRVKLRAVYNEKSLRYDIKEKVKIFLEHYNIDFDEFEATLLEIENNVDLRPFHN